VPPLPHVKEATYVIEGFNEAVVALAAYHKKRTATGFLEPFKILCRTLTRLCNDKLFWRDLGRVAFSEDERVVDEALGNLDQLLDLERQTLLDAGVSIDACELIVQATIYLAEYRSLPIDYLANRLQAGVTGAKDEICQRTKKAIPAAEWSKLVKAAAVTGGAALIVAGEKSPVPGTSTLTTPLGKQLIRKALGGLFERKGSPFRRFFGG
jgi:hypothetical protein